MTAVLTSLDVETSDTDWTCTCGNTSSDVGFTPCDDRGIPAPGSSGRVYGCGSCGFYFDIKRRLHQRPALGRAITPALVTATLIEASIPMRSHAVTGSTSVGVGGRNNNVQMTVDGDDLTEVAALARRCQITLLDAGYGPIFRDGPVLWLVA